METTFGTPAHRRTLEEWLEYPINETIANSLHLKWTDVVLHHMHYPPMYEYGAMAASDTHSLVTNLHGAPRWQLRFPDGSSFDGYVTANSLQLLPVNYPIDTRWNTFITVALVQLSPHIAAHFEDEAFRGDPARIQLLPTQNFHDPLLEHLLNTLLHDVHSPGPLGNLFAEQVSHIMMLHLLRKYSTAFITSPTQFRHGQFNAAQLRVLNEYIAEHLDERIALSDLARTLHVSVPHFERTFRATLHRPPYRYVLERRIERAKELLGEGKHSLHEVARLCGFANQSHFTRHFTRFVGVSPARFVLHSQR